MGVESYGSGDAVCGHGMVVWFLPFLNFDLNKSCCVLVGNASQMGLK